MPEYGFSVTRILPYKDESTILSLHGRIQVSENPYSCIFYQVYVPAKFAFFIFYYFHMFVNKHFTYLERAYLRK